MKKIKEDYDKLDFRELRMIEYNRHSEIRRAKIKEDYNKLSSRELWMIEYNMYSRFRQTTLYEFGIGE